ncbi:Fructosamine/Ketosamine-3-kinase [Rhexocercosporidium sp. MPI-PUGE-AT-0058]|nr:Fructosamine/Ketosamine-3-kinase [Rhexocercosporidium sp. MPI-PUGE-AT-0058]
MAAKIDPSILKALSLDAANTALFSHGSSGFSSTYKLSSRGSDGEEKLYFVKTGGKGSEVMFAGEHLSLNTIHNIAPTLCPNSFAHGALSSSSGSFLATDFLNLSPPSSSKTGSGTSLAHKLAKLHSTPAPIPEGYEKPMFGFPVPTCCGETVQDNEFKESWADFYAENRLRHILKCAETNQGASTSLSSLVQTTINKVVPRLLRPGHLISPDGSPIVPIVVHGDLWSGNRGKGTIGTGGVEEVVFDPSACYAHSEFEFGIMGMFGGFGGEFNKEYWEVKGKDEPVGEWEDRRSLYELYHHLNHYSMFGGGYKSGAESIMRNLIKKYGEDN